MQNNIKRKYIGLDKILIIHIEVKYIYFIPINFSFYYIPPFQFFRITTNKDIFNMFEKEDLN